MGSSSESYIDMREKEYLVSATFKVKGKLINSIENYLYETTNLINYKTIVDTDKLYQKDDVFKKIVKDIKKMNRVKEDYINKHN